MQSHASWAVDLAGILVIATENFQLTAGSLNAAGVGMKLSASATADWYLAFFQWSESLKVELEEVAFFFFPDPSCHSLCTLEICLRASYILFFCLPPPPWSYEELSAPPSSSVHIRCYRVKLEQVSAKKGWGEQKRLHSVLPWRGVGEG